MIIFSEIFKMIKMIASDLDGTLLLNGAQSLNPEVFDLIRRLKEEKNIIFVSSSGRQYANQRNLFEPVADEIAYVCENGCFAMYNDEMLHFETLDRELGETILKDISARGNDEELLLSGIETSYICPKNESYLIHLRDVVKNNVTVVNDILSTKEPYFKIAVCSWNGCRGTFEYYHSKYGKKAHVVTGGSIWTDIMPRGVTKRTSLEHICRRLGIDPCECVAFGDNFNDLEMLDYVGIPVSMNSAVPGVYEHCSRHTDTVENALLAILEDRFC